MLLAAMLLALLLLPSACQKTTPVHRTEGSNREWIMKHLQELSKRISPSDGAKVRFVFSTMLTSSLAAPNKPNDFTLGIGEKFFQPDDHGSAVFTVKEIKKSSVVLDYKEKFDHRSFGKNMITEDAGTVELSYTP